MYRRYQKMGFENVTVIEAQAELNGNGQFPTVKLSNPEESEAIMMVAASGPKKLMPTW
ncbi:MAG: hypothetical protein R2822_24790 [Spirosomataceae bacterium]